MKPEKKKVEFIAHFAVRERWAGLIQSLWAEQNYWLSTSSGEAQSSFTDLGDLKRGKRLTSSVEAWLHADCLAVLICLPGLVCRWLAFRSRRLTLIGLFAEHWLHVHWEVGIALIYGNRLERVWRKGNPLTLLVGMQTGTATTENSVEVP